GSKFRAAQISRAKGGCYELLEGVVAISHLAFDDNQLSPLVDAPKVACPRIVAGHRRENPLDRIRPAGQGRLAWPICGKIPEPQGSLLLVHRLLILVSVGVEGPMNPGIQNKGADATAAFALAVRFRQFHLKTTRRP